MPGCHRVRDKDGQVTFSSHAPHLLDDATSPGHVPSGKQHHHQAQVTPADHRYVTAPPGQVDTSLRPIQCPIQIIQLSQHLTPYREKAAGYGSVRPSARFGKLHLLLAQLYGLL